MTNRDARYRIAECFEHLAEELGRGPEHHKAAVDDFVKNAAMIAKTYRDLLREIDDLHGHINWAMEKIKRHQEKGLPQMSAEEWIAKGAPAPLEEVL
jgi:hypothetical protein